MAVKAWSKRGLPDIPVESSEEFQITMVLPTWNEEKIVEAKLEDVKSQDYPSELIEVVIIDANSDDRTIEIAEEWIARNGQSSGIKFRIIKEDERRGKSVSINRAFREASQESQILMMSDVDCRLSKDAISRVTRWFGDREIGAITGRQILINPGKSRQVSQEESYRSFYTSLRIAESCLDSTPIFHGECAAYRREAIEGFELVENSNADDSQMALAAIKSGYRAIYDPKITFFEMAPPDSRSSNVQKVRRAQGLIRHFWRNRGIISDKSAGSFRQILALEFAMHILLPVFVVVGFISGIGHIASIAMGPGLSLDLLADRPDVESVMLLADAVVVALLICGALGIPFPASRLSLSFLIYMMTLFKAQMLAIRGKSLHKWQQVPLIREALMEHDAGRGAE
jgi:cellulose synthase/poly-beta-1,6-N-acetylglucosamine synthase-like glycosyltransferase